MNAHSSYVRSFILPSIIHALARANMVNDQIVLAFPQSSIMRYFSLWSCRSSDSKVNLDPTCSEVHWRSSGDAGVMWKQTAQLDTSPAMALLHFSELGKV